MQQQKTNLYLRLLLMVVAPIFVLSSVRCTPDAPAPTFAPTNAPTPTVAKWDPPTDLAWPTPEKTVYPTLSPSTNISSNVSADTAPTKVIIFLIDESKSVVDNCGPDRDRYNVPLYLLNLLSKEFRLPGDKLYFGVNGFAENSRAVLSPTTINELGRLSDLWKPYLIESHETGQYTSYANALSTAETIFFQEGPSGDDVQRVLVLLTDGDINETEEESLRSELLKLINASVHIYVPLLCPSKIEAEDVAFWESEIGSRKNVDVLSVSTNNTKTWIKTLIENELISYLPQDSFWIDGSSADEGQRNGIQIPSYGQVIIHNYAYSGIGGYEIQDPQGLFLQSLPPNNSQIFSQPTRADCEPYSVDIVAASDDDSGLLWIEKIISDISFRWVNDPFILNYEPVNFRIEVNSQTPMKLLEQQFCYRANLRILLNDNGDQINEPIPNECTSETMCWDVYKNELFAAWVWEPTTFQSLQDIPFQMELLLDNQIITSSVVTLPVLLQPQVTIEPNDWISTHAITSAIEFAFPTSYVLFPPMITLTSDHTGGEQQEVNKQLMEIKDSSGASYACLPSSEHLMTDPNHPLTSNTPYDILEPQCNGTNVTFRLRLLRYLVDNCGYDTVVFYWPQGENSLEATWKCQLSENYGCALVP